MACANPLLHPALLRWLPPVSVALALALPGMATSAAPPVLELYLPEAPPLSMQSVGATGELSGIVGEVTLKAAALAGYELRAKTLPWARAQYSVQRGEDQLIIPLSRTPDRESHYTWIAPVFSMDRAFFSLGRPVQSFAEARATYAHIAVGMGSAQEQKLREEGFSDEQIHPLKIGENPAQMLLLGRVDAWFNGVPESPWIWRQVSSRPLSMSPPLMTADLYLACSKACQPQIVERLREAVQRLREDGTIARIVQAYQVAPLTPP